MTTVDDICKFMDQFAPAELAESWDNTGLLVGDRTNDVAKIMTCLTITPQSASEAVQRDTDLIITHHPLPFRPLTKLTTDDSVGKLLLMLIEAKVAVFSPHTRFDSANLGINQLLAERIQLQNILPLTPLDEPMQSMGSGRVGMLANDSSLREFAQNVKNVFGCTGIQVVGDLNCNISKVAVACGSGGSFLDTALQQSCDALVTGETNFHTCLEAQASGASLVLLGHFASERFGLENLADRIQSQFANVQCWASANEADPIDWI